MKFIWCLLTLSLTLVNNNYAFLHQIALSEIPQISILPKPQKMIPQDCIFEISQATKIIIYSPGDTSFINSVHLLKANIASHGFWCPIVKMESNPDFLKSIIFVKYNQQPFIELLLKNNNIKWKKEMDEEGYVITVDGERCYLVAKSDRGLYYAVQTLKQILQKLDDKLVIPGVVVQDWPEFKMRGISEDISRGQVPTILNFQKRIRFLSENKLNTYMLYIEDMFQFDQYPYIGMQRGALSSKELFELQQYAKKCHVEIIPIFQTLGHFENILIQPRFQHLGEFPGATTLNCLSEDTYVFLENLLAEIVPVFESVYFHIGGDECWDLGRGAAIEVSHEKGRSFLLGQHFQRVYEILKQYNKKVIIYGDMIWEYPQLLKELPQDLIILDWQYEPKKWYSSISRFSRAKQPLIVSPGLSNWRRLYPDYNNAFKNIDSVVKNAQRYKTLGVITASWGDYGGENLHELNYYGFAYSAECTWNGSGGEVEHFNKKYFKNFYGTYQAELDTIYTYLNEIGEIALLSDFWKYPFRNYNFNDPLLLQNIIKLQQKARLTMKLIRNISPAIKYNKEHLKSLAFVAKWSLIAGRKLQYSYEIVKMCQDKEKSEPDFRTKSTLVAMCGAMIHELQQLKAEFRAVWLANNKLDNLQYIMDLYEHHIYFWQKMINQIKNEHFYCNGKLHSQWIHHPNSKSRSRGIHHVFFLKDLTLPANIKSFKIQTIGQSHLKIYYNGYFIGEQVARPSASLIVEQERVKLWDLTNKSLAGANHLSIEVFSYEPFRPAGINIYGEVVFENGEKYTVLSDETWWVTDEPPAGSERSEINPNNWKKAQTRESEWFITQPDFEEGILSAIERK